jgi:hypothetical protein
MDRVHGLTNFIKRQPSNIGSTAQILYREGVFLSSNPGCWSTDQHWRFYYHSNRYAGSKQSSSDAAFGPQQRHGHLSGESGAAVPGHRP